jgi:ElaB/YqjD/DUF883 family membrane-anchored ribosome-binding protein
MAMRMLEAGGMAVVTDGQRAADASNPMGYFEFEPVKDLDKPGDHAWLADARGKAVKIISFLLTHLPESYDYQVIFMQRDLDEVLASQNKMLDSRGETGGAADERMRAVYEQHLAQVARLMNKRACFATLYLPYAEVVSEPRAQAARMSGFIGARLDVEAMAAIADGALYRNRRDRSNFLVP